MGASPELSADAEVGTVGVLRQGSSIQPSSVPYLGYHVPREVRVKAERTAIVLAVLALVIAVPFGHYVIGTLIAMAAALATALAQTWLREDRHGPLRDISLVASGLVALAIVTSSVGALYDVIRPSTVEVAHTVPAPGGELYGLLGTQTPTIFDLRPGGCAIGTDGVARSNGTVVNLVSRPKRYSITVQFESKSGTVLANETDELQPLDPQGASAFSVSAAVAITDGLRCYITEVRATNP